MYVIINVFIRNVILVVNIKINVVNIKKEKFIFFFSSVCVFQRY